eukprot:scaffold116774_cov31-Tisochrysis_lutea.AAC.1
MEGWIACDAADAQGVVPLAWAAYMRAGDKREQHGADGFSSTGPGQSRLVFGVWLAPIGFEPDRAIMPQHAHAHSSGQQRGSCNLQSMGHAHRFSQDWCRVFQCVVRVREERLSSRVCTDECRVDRSGHVPCSAQVTFRKVQYHERELPKSRLLKMLPVAEPLRCRIGRIVVVQHAPPSE